MTQQTALNILKTGASVFLTGEPGAGKSHTVREFVDFLRDHGIDPVVTASTGIAATHIGGMTIHSWSGLGIRSYLSDYDLEFLAQQEYLVKRVNKATTVIIDEISMIDGRTLSLVDTILRYLRRVDAPFGGIQMVFVGDFFQLPPIGSRSNGDEDSGPQFACACTAWQDLSPIVCYLSEQHRTEDDNFLKVLSGIRSQKFDSTHKKLLMSRVVSADELPPHATQLYTHNARVDEMNIARLNRISGDARIYSMSGTGSRTMIESLQRNCLSPSELALKPGATVMFTKNIPQLRVMNGTLGTIVEYSRSTGFPLVRTLATGNMVAADPVEWVVETDGKVKARITQVPLRLAWAITIHKSQGMSLDAAVIDLSAAFEYGQGYVALSRVRSLVGVYLLGINERGLMVHPDVVGYDEGFRINSEEATETYESIAPENIEMMHQKFVEASGGEWDKQKVVNKRVKIDTYTQTELLVKEGKSCADIVETRGLTVGTILEHIEKLTFLERLTKADLETLFPDTEERIVPPAVAAQFSKQGTEKLAPIFTSLHGRFSYDDLKRMRMMYIVGQKLK